MYNQLERKLFLRPADTDAGRDTHRATDGKT
jgi:hypothetical protein